jgi:hypothetical protein
MRAVQATTPAPGIAARVTLEFDAILGPECTVEEITSTVLLILLRPWQHRSDSDCFHAGLPWEDVERIAGEIAKAAKRAGRAGP